MAVTSGSPSPDASPDASPDGASDVAGLGRRGIRIMAVTSGSPSPDASPDASPDGASDVAAGVSAGASERAPAVDGAPAPSPDPARAPSEGTGWVESVSPTSAVFAASVVTSLPARCLTSNIMAATRTWVRRANVKIRRD
ncbi:hypothetical protein GCM10010517_37500 [Streptosporangium fragile]|uniref:Uncharacterized protein n=1 Tax=Streptosporangium fragile TaxID=46186 RepID=A0ABN3VZK3_9ACTN